MDKSKQYLSKSHAQHREKTKKKRLDPKKDLA